MASGDPASRVQTVFGLQPVTQEIETRFEDVVSEGLGFGEEYFRSE